MLKFSHIAGSSNGRTTDSESVYQGSNPCPAAIRLATLAHGHGREANVLSDERSEESKEMPYTVYILRFSNNNLYIGQTNNLPQRLKDHNSKNSHSSKFSKD